MNPVKQSSALPTQNLMAVISNDKQFGNTLEMEMDEEIQSLTGYSNAPPPPPPPYKPGMVVGKGSKASVAAKLYVEKGKISGSGGLEKKQATGMGMGKGMGDGLVGKPRTSAALRRQMADDMAKAKVVSDTHHESDVAVVPRVHNEEIETAMKLRHKSYKAIMHADEVLPPATE